MKLASDGIVTKGMWEALINARHYADDIASATEKARATALNEKVQNPLKDFKGAGVPNLSGGGAGSGEKKPKKSVSGFAEFGQDEL